MITYTVTLRATITLDLTQAIRIGGVLSAAVSINQVANLEIEVREVDADKLRSRGLPVVTDCGAIRAAYLTGPLVFAATTTFNEAFAHKEGVQVLILSMQAVPMVDVSGLEALAALHEQLSHAGQTLMLAGVHPNVVRMLERSHLAAAIGVDNFFWSADQAILVAEQRYLLADYEVNADAVTAPAPARRPTGRRMDNAPRLLV